MNRFGINLWNWCAGLSDDCLGKPTRAAELGFTAVELPMTVPTVSPALAGEIRSTGLAVSLCAAMGPGRDLSSENPAVRSATMAYLTDCLKTGQALGASVFCGPLYAGGGKRHWLSPDEKKAEWERAVTGIQALSRIAEDCGIALALEPLNRYRTSVANTAGQILDMLRDIGRANVGLHYDTYHACLEEKDLLASLKNALESGKVFHFHACANNRGAPGQGIVPWDSVMDLLVQFGYGGHITMETFAPHGLDSSWIDVHEAPDLLAANGLRYLKEYFAGKGLA